MIEGVYSVIHHMPLTSSGIILLSSISLKLHTLLKNVQGHVEW